MNQYRKSEKFRSPTILMFRKRNILDWSHGEFLQLKQEINEDKHFLILQNLFFFIFEIDLFFKDSSLIYLFILLTIGSLPPELFGPM
jgi:hypothetical protein